MAPAIALIGPPGAGKSTVGAILADRLGLRLVDTDTLVEDRTGRSIPDIFVQDGEPAFRELEREAVAAALDLPEAVVSLGGGAVMQEEVAAALTAHPHTVVFLDVTIADASARVGFDTSRPLLVVNPRASWTRLMNARRPTYESLADLTVQTGGRTPEEVAEQILAGLGHDG